MQPDMSHTYVLDEDGYTPIRCDDFEVWARQFQGRHGSPLGTSTLVAPGVGTVLTLFTGVDIDEGRLTPPLLFTTALIGARFREVESVRTATWQEAGAAHQQMVERCRERFSEKVTNTG